MSELEKPKGKNIPAKVLTCEFFEHHLNPHYHGCLNVKNATKRCGFDVSDLKTCPLVGKIVEKDIRLSKPLTVPTPEIKVLIKPDKPKLDRTPEPDQKPLNQTTKTEVPVPTQKKDDKTVAPPKVGISPDPAVIVPAQLTTKAEARKEAQAIDDAVDKIEEESEHQISHTEAVAIVAKKKKIGFKKGVAENIPKK